jgi:hypothetical protein
MGVKMNMYMQGLRGENNHYEDLENRRILLKWIIVE